MSPKKKAKDTEAKAVSHYYYDVLRHPLITEKTTALSELNKVVFKVDGNATKTDIKAAVEALFNVKVESVNTLIRKGKRKGFKGTNGQQSDSKRAIVTLEAGQTVDFAAGAR